MQAIKILLIKTIVDGAADYLKLNIYVTVRLECTYNFFYT